MDLKECPGGLLLTREPPDCDPPCPLTSVIVNNHNVHRVYVCIKTF